MDISSAPQGYINCLYYNPLTGNVGYGRNTTLPDGVVILFTHMNNYVSSLNSRAIKIITAGGVVYERFKTLDVPYIAFDDEIKINYTTGKIEVPSGTLLSSEGVYPFKPSDFSIAKFEYDINNTDLIHTLEFNLDLIIAGLNPIFMYTNSMVRGTDTEKFIRILTTQKGHVDCYFPYILEGEGTDIKAVDNPNSTGSTYISNFQNGVDGWAGVGLSVSTQDDCLKTIANVATSPWVWKGMDIKAGDKIRVRMKAVSGGSLTNQHPQLATRDSNNVITFIIPYLNNLRPFYNYEDDGFETLNFVAPVDGVRLHIYPTALASVNDTCLIQSVQVGDLEYNESSVSKKAIELANSLGNTIQYKTSAKGFWNYNVARYMPPDLLRGIVETASNNKCTVIYDDLGQPSMMFRIPLVALGALDSAFGDLATPHPAFIVNGIVKKCVYIACYQSTELNNRMVSWPGLFPTPASNAKAREASGAKGAGWHQMTIFERSLVNLLGKKLYGEPRGNTDYGRSHVAGFEAETAERKDGLLAGIETFGMPIRNGSSPHSWAHNQQQWGIFDLIGNFWEQVDLLKTVNGQIFIPDDNRFAADESEWLATGAYFSESNGAVVLSNSAGTLLSEHTYTNWNEALVTPGYDLLSVDLRQKLAALLIAPRLLSTDLSPAIELDGRLWVRTDGTYYAMAHEAQEYRASCGYGSLCVAYPKDEGHGNMGARLAYIKGDD